METGRKMLSTSIFNIEKHMKGSFIAFKAANKSTYKTFIYQLMQLCCNEKVSGFVPQSYILSELEDMTKNIKVYQISS